MMNDKITGLDLVEDCDFYSDFSKYCDDCMLTTIRNFDILDKNMEIFKRNVQTAILANGNKKLVSKIEAITRIQDEMAQANHSREMLFEEYVKKFTSISLLFKLEAVDLKFGSSNLGTLEEYNNFEEKPVEPQPPVE